MRAPDFEMKATLTTRADHPTPNRFIALALAVSSRQDVRPFDNLGSLGARSEARRRSEIVRQYSQWSTVGLRDRESANFSTGDVECCTY